LQYVICNNEETGCDVKMCLSEPGCEDQRSESTDPSDYATTMVYYDNVETNETPTLSI